MTASTDTHGEQPAGAPSPRTALLLSIPAILIGLVTAVVLIALTVLADWLETLVWQGLPGLLGVGDTTGWWTMGVLTLTGLIVGLIVWLAPGHAGPDPATTGLVAPPLAIGVLPALAAVLVIGEAGGVSLGPENPVIAINTALTVAITAKLWPRVPLQLVVLMSAAGTIGALFGTPVGAALVLTGIVGMTSGGGALWDKLFLPLVSAGTGSLVMAIAGRPNLSVDVPALGAPELIDLVSGVAVAAVAVLLGLLGVYLFPLLHRPFHLLRNPVLPLTIAGSLLGVLGVLGGPDTLFKGLTEMKDLTANAAELSVGQLVAVTLIKLAALLIAATAGFRGGRVFPAAFIGVAVGLVAHAVFAGIPPSLAIASGVLGMVLVVTRDGWLSLFMAVTVVADITVLPLLCIIVLPIWLMVTRQPPMLIGSSTPTAAPAGPSTPPH
ncbi:ion channel protein [Microterricola pindariensis]|uniref:Ion channel protein n=1 Tax=Microterricola pindariensis TaxID=478010 RepID=A0ABX5ATH9_9MICO|nr:ion channel protein [Microterricola pindariensis]PPL16331.1 ion channel protein [Microterricola pindariensis]